MLKDDLIKVFNKINDKYHINNVFSDNSKSYMSLIEKINSFIDIKEDDFIILGARSGMGKNSFWLTISNELIKEDTKVIIFSLKRKKEDLILDLLSQESNCNSFFTKLGYISQMTLEDITKKIGELVVSFENLFILDKFYLTLQEIEDQIIINKSEKTLVIIDELQSLVSEKDYVETCRQLKILTRKLNVPILLTSQLDPWIDKRRNKRPLINDLDYQGNISNYADKILFLYREDFYTPETAKAKLIEIIISKNVDGFIDTLELYFDCDLRKILGLERNY